MCDTCGCESTGNKTTYTLAGKEGLHSHTHSHDHSHAGDGHSHAHPHSHEHDHIHEGSHHHEHIHDSENELSHHEHSHGKPVKVEMDILSKNNLLAERNRGFFEAKKIKVLNLMSSPGSGKTTLLEKTIKLLARELSLAVIEGDQQTMNDAIRIQNAGAPVLQVNTGNGCHLDSSMINRAIQELDLKEKSVLFIENVGNLVCPSLFDLGESARVVIISTTEGEDKPVKYPTMFSNADLCIINKTDLLPYLDFDVEKCKQFALKVNSKLEFIELSAKTEEGIGKWLEWVKKGL